MLTKCFRKAPKNSGTRIEIIVSRFYQLDYKKQKKFQEETQKNNELKIITQTLLGKWDNNITTN